VFQVAPSLHLVEVRKAKGDTLEFHKVESNFASKDIAFNTVRKVFFWYLFGAYRLLICIDLLLQFYKKLSNSLKSVVWKTEEEMQQTIKQN